MNILYFFCLLIVCGKVCIENIIMIIGGLKVKLWFYRKKKKVGYCLIEKLEGNISCGCLNN